MGVFCVLFYFFIFSFPFFLFFVVLPFVVFVVATNPGAIAGLLAARYLAPALVWGGVGESDGIRPDSQATSWSTRREALTNQYVSRLAAKARDAAAASDIASADDGGGGGAGEHESKERQDSDAEGAPKNLTDLTAGALEVCCVVLCCVFVRVSNGGGAKGLKCTYMKKGVSQRHLKASRAEGKATATAAIVVIRPWFRSDSTEIRS